jgi:coniferyl-aldehyde dehydrogenase
MTTTADELERLLSEARRAFAAQPLPDAGTRRAWLGSLARLLKGNERAICAAIDADFGGRPAAETRLVEIFPSLEGIRHARRHVARWMRPERRSVSVWFKPGRAEVRHQPLGVVGIIVPWNYPLLLAVGPLVGALAAGNRVLIKMSEYSQALGRLLAEQVRECLPADLVTVVNGDADVAAQFSALPFDHLLFTGSTAVGKRVMAAAAKNLTPVTLELGGKSPAILAPGCDIATAAQRIVFGKLLNAGQTCVAPDYVLLPRALEGAFVAAARSVATRLYGDAGSPDLASVAQPRQLQRLEALVADARAKGARIESLLAAAAVQGRRFAPVMVLGVTDEMHVMQEEIFGPILPIVPYDTLAAAVEQVNRRDRPLALYVFAGDRGRIAELLDQTTSGGVTVNDCIIHSGQNDLPFGGVGPSGMGRYHGRDGFLTFSVARAVFRQSRLSPVPLLYPPYRKRLSQWIMRLMLR